MHRGCNLSAFPPTESPSTKALSLSIVTVDADYALQANFATLLPTIYVDDDASEDPGPGNPTISDPNEDGSRDHPFDMIQEAIDVAVDGLNIVVFEGVYYETIDLSGRNIILTSFDPNDADVVTNTIIDGSVAGSVVTFSSDEDANCVLTGFTITNGSAQSGGAVYCYNSSPTISHCIFSKNLADNGGGLSCYESSPRLTRCILSGNWAKDGGGMFNFGSSPSLRAYPNNP